MTDTPSYYPTRDPQKTVAELKVIIGEKFAGDKVWLELLLEQAEQREEFTENTRIALRELIAECQPQKELTMATRSTQHIHLVHCDVTVNYNGREIAGKITDTTDAENGLYISILPNAAQDADVIGVWLPLRGAKLSHELPIFPPHQMDMFIDTGRVDDLPLFSNTPQRVPASHFDPPTVSKAKQTKLF